MEDLAARMRTRHGDELLRSIEPDGFVSQGSKVTEIAAGSATEIKNRVRRVALYRIEECSVILADIVLSRAVPEGPCEPIVIRDRRFAEAPDRFGVIHTSGAAHRPSAGAVLGSVRFRGIRRPGAACTALRARQSPQPRVLHSRWQSPRRGGAAWLHRRLAR